MAAKTKPRGSLRVARLLGVDVRVHWSFLGLVVFVALVSSDWTQVGSSLVWIVAVFASVLLHELAHCVVARRRGAEVEDILLLPIGGVSQMKSMPEAPPDELAIAAVGPLSSIVLGLAALAAGMVLGSQVWPPTLFAGSWFARLGWLNLLLGGFNLLPALPMDGGRILRAALAEHHSRVEATRLAGQIARFFAILMIVGGVFYDFWLALIGIFVWVGASAEEDAVLHPERYRDRTEDGAKGASVGSWPPESASRPPDSGYRKRPRQEGESQDERRSA